MPLCVNPLDRPAFGVGIDRSPVAALEQGTVAAAVIYDPAIPEMMARHPDMRILRQPRPGGGADRVRRR